MKTERRRYCLALDLVDDAQLIETYRNYHRPGNVWPEILASIREAGVLDMEIYHTGDRLLMIMEVDDNFSFEDKAEQDATNPKVAEWEALMARFQRPLAGAAPGEKWLPMERIFSLSEQ